MSDFTLLKNFLTENEIPYSDYLFQNLSFFTNMLLETNEKMNLTAITDLKEIEIKHYIDSIYPLKYGLIKDTDKVIDVGTGAGFPGIPLKLCRKEIDILLLDSLRKRLDFLDGFIANANLKKIDTIHKRAEEAGREKNLRESFDKAVSRAVAPLCVLCEYVLPFVKVGGLFIAYKGQSAEEEIEGARKAIKILGSEIENVYEFELPEISAKRNLIVIKKISQISTAYPRKSKNITQKPL